MLWYDHFLYFHARFSLLVLLQKLPLRSISEGNTCTLSLIIDNWRITSCSNRQIGMLVFKCYIINQNECVTFYCSSFSSVCWDPNGSELRTVCESESLTTPSDSKCYFCQTDGHKTLWSERPHPVAGMLLSLPSRGLHPHCIWTGGILGCNHSHLLSTPGPVHAGVMGWEERAWQWRQEGEQIISSSFLTLKTADQHGRVHVHESDLKIEYKLDFRTFQFNTSFIFRFLSQK